VGTAHTTLVPKLKTAMPVMAQGFKIVVEYATQEACQKDVAS
jgi:hypothetical protein